MESAAGQDLRCPSVHMLTRSCNSHKSTTGCPRTPSPPLDDYQKPSSSNHSDSLPQGSFTTPSSPSQGEVSEPHGSVAGILYKWVNFGKGWRVRWFVLKNGVLSYYKVHGPDKITLSDEKYAAARIIGEESQKLIKRHRNIHRPRKSFGEVHLQVASIRQSSSDDKKFYIFTGTKTLHLRAENKDDRRAWLEALCAAKDYVQGGVTKQASEPPSFQMEVSTKLLRNRLLQEGVAESVIVDCEEILRAEFSVLLKHLNILEDNHINLLEKLKQLEGDKLELETTVVDESQNKAGAEGDALVEEGQDERAHSVVHDTFFGAVRINRRDDILAIVDSRWEFIRCSIHGMAAILHPFYKTPDLFGDIPLLTLRSEYLNLMLSEDEQLVIDGEMSSFMNNLGLTYLRSVATRPEATKLSLSWWQNYGRLGLPQLCKLASSTQASGLSKPGCSSHPYLGAR
ncbi:hypothetical protein L7F22_062631 [Adiantum nelumboides]|nr:hypothetical protein [Adiantum nelumboides]